METLYLLFWFLLHVTKGCLRLHFIWKIFFFSQNNQVLSCIILTPMRSCVVIKHRVVTNELFFGGYVT